MRIHTRNDLIKFIEDNAPFTGVLRAALNHNENLGGFSRLSINHGSGWIVRLTSKFNRQWLIGVAPDKTLASKYRIWILFNSVPWKFWEGDKSENLLYRGDRPEEYKLLRNKEIRRCLNLKEQI
ncbi:hypothetical protein LCGC14_0360070 [marine sediment metagenome]|uniref:Uncharacterized protein n=1 Tax=marine sediment metagenome TaxID=412755 RepID=A0A0F9WGG8_9ZZZZ